MTFFLTVGSLNKLTHYFLETLLIDIYSFNLDIFQCLDKLVLAGSGCESTAATVRVTNKMAEAGAGNLFSINQSINESIIAIKSVSVNN